MRCPICLVIAISFSTVALAVTVPGSTTDGRFADLTVPDPGWRINARPARPATLEGFDAQRAAWNVFRAEHGVWNVYVDTRTGAPLLAEGVGIPFFANDPDRPVKAQFEARALEFVGTHREAFAIDPAELVLDEKSSSPDGHHWQVVFHHEVDGIPVEGETLLFFVNFGKLVSFGATRWGKTGTVPEIKLTEHSARERLYRHMGLQPDDQTEDLQPARLVFVAGPPREDRSPYVGPVGEGVRYRLAWRFLVKVSGESGIWSAAVDATSGDVISFYDTVLSSEVKGGVYGFSNDQDCPDGCEQPNRPMPYADVTPAGESTLYANDVGVFSCSSNDTIATSLQGDHDPSVGTTTVTIDDKCLPSGINETANDCGEDIDVGFDTGTDCESTGASAAARTAYYHGNRILEKARGWWPGTAWAENLYLNLTVNATIEQCNAFFWGGGGISLNKSGGICRNTGEVPGIVHHEAGHAISYQDSSGPTENPYEGVADVFALVQGRTSCIGDGLRETGVCDTYGVPYNCLPEFGCEGYREADFAKRTPSGPMTAQWLEDHPGGGSSGATPCGFGLYAESHLILETVYDLAARDLPAMGMDEDSAWQLTEKLFYMTRGPASVGNAYSCYESPPGTWHSSGCLSSSWFKRFLVADDDGDGTANGTPHAAAIFAAFDRHGIACGDATDPENQNQSACSSGVETPALTVTTNPDSRTLEWTAVPFATEYLVSRNDLGCGYSFNIIARTSETSYVDDGVPEEFEVYYRVQATTTPALTTGTCPAPLEFNCGGPDCEPQHGPASSRVPTGMSSCLDSGSGTLFSCDPGQELYIETTDCGPVNPDPPYPLCLATASKMICGPTQLCESPVSNCEPCSYTEETCPAGPGLDCGEGCRIVGFPVNCPETSYGGESCVYGDGTLVCCDEGEELYIKTCQCEPIGFIPKGGPEPICIQEVSTTVCR